MMKWYEVMFQHLVDWWLTVGRSHPSVLGFIVASVVAGLKMRTQKKSLLWAEVLLCGVFAAIALYSLDVLALVLSVDELPREIAAAVGGAIGWYGTEKTVEYISSRTPRFQTKDKERDNDSDKG